MTYIINRSFGYGYEWMSRRTSRRFGCGYKCLTELTEVLYRSIPWKIPVGIVLYVPYRAQSCTFVRHRIHIICWNRLWAKSKRGFKTWFRAIFDPLYVAGTEVALFPALASPCSPLTTLPGVALAVLALCPGGGVLFFICFYIYLFPCTVRT